MAKNETTKATDNAANEGVESRKEQLARLAGMGDDKSPLKLVKAYRMPDGKLVDRPDDDTVKSWVAFEMFYVTGEKSGTKVVDRENLHPAISLSVTREQLRDLPSEMAEHLAMHGLSQKVGDAAVSSKANPKMGDQRVSILEDALKALLVDHSWREPGQGRTSYAERLSVEDRIRVVSEAFESKGRALPDVEQLTALLSDDEFWLGDGGEKPGACKEPTVAALLKEWEAKEAAERARERAGAADGDALAAAFGMG